MKELRGRRYTSPKAELLVMKSCNSILKSFSLGGAEGEDWSNEGYEELED